MRLAAALIAALALAAPAAAATRPAPTTDRIRVFSDQLPDGPGT